MLDRIYVITNKTEGDKNLESLEKSVLELGICKQFIRQKGIEGDILPDDQLEIMKSVSRKNWKEPSTGRGMFRGEIACAANHFGCWKNIIKEEVGTFLIIEDDIIINRPKTLKEELERLLSDLEKVDWDLCSLGRRPVSENESPMVIKSDDSILEVSESLVRMKESRGAYCYLVNPEGAKKLANIKFAKEMFPVDEYINVVSGISRDEALNEEYEQYRVTSYATKRDNCFFDHDEAVNSLRCITSSGIAGIKRDTKIKFYTVATREHDGLTRLIHSAEYYGIDLKVLGLNQDWTDGDFGRLVDPGGGQKINILKKELGNLDDDDLLLFVDGYDMVFMSGPEEIEEKFETFNSKVVFGAEKSCWPDTSLYDAFPEIQGSNYRFLNSGNFMGYVGELKKITEENIFDSDDDQLYYQKKFLSKGFSMRLDHRAEIFQCIAFCFEDEDKHTELKIENGRLKNKIHGTYPCTLHGNGSKEMKIVHNWFCNYIGGKRYKGEATMNGQKNIFNGMPSVFISLFMEKKGDSVEILEGISDLSFPKENTILSISYDESKINFSTSPKIEEALSRYKKVYIKRVEAKHNPRNRDLALEFADSLNVDYYFYIDDHFKIKKVDILENLVFVNRELVAPLGVSGGHSNYWGETDENGFYKQATDYYDIIRRDKIGIWDGPYVFAAYLIKKSAMPQMKGAYSENYDSGRGSDMAFCSNALDRGIMPCVDNRHVYGETTSF